MSSARDQFGPPKPQTSDIEQRMRDLQQNRLAEIKQLGQSLQQAGVKQDGSAQGQQAAHKNSTNGSDSNNARKDPTVGQGERAALSPCDGKVQAETRQAGQAMKNSGATKSAAKEFSSPAKTPSPPAQSAGGRSR